MLTLYTNLLSDYPVWDLAARLPALTKLSVGGNNWPCDCHTVRQLASMTILTDNNLLCHTEAGKALPTYKKLSQ